MHSFRVKYYLVCVAVVLGTLVLMFISMLLLAYQYAETNEQNTLFKCVDNAIEITQDQYAQYDGTLVEEALRDAYRGFTSLTDSTMFLTDVQGITFISADDSPQGEYVAAVPQRVIDTAIRDGIYIDTGLLDDVFSTAHFTLARPVYTYSGSGRALGVLFISKSAATTASFYQDIMVIFLISGLISLILAFFVTYFATRGIVQPIYDMTDAALNYSRGDFKKRIPVETGDEIARLAISFNRMADSFTQIEQRQQNFIGSVSHELKTPMTTIGGFVDGILDKTIPEDQHEHYLQIISSEIKRLSSVVKSMLDIVKLDADQINLNTRPFDIVETTIQVFLTFEQRIEEKQLNVEGLDSPPAIVYADTDTVMQVLYNIIDNAVKFVQRGGTLAFRFEPLEDHVLVGILNTGQGIAKEDIDHIFDQFYKSDKSRSPDSPGTGLGLFIVKTLVELNGGSIRVTSAPGEYTEFTVTLPTKARRMKR